MAEAIYVHIGAPKAGSSYLQKMLAAHAETLSEAGFFLPLATRAAQFAAAADLRGETWTDEQAHSGRRWLPTSHPATGRASSPRS